MSGGVGSEKEPPAITLLPRVQEACLRTQPRAMQQLVHDDRTRLHFERTILEHFGFAAQSPLKEEHVL